MPMTGSTDDRFREFGEGKTYARTKRKYGVKRANKQRVAAVLSSLRRGSKRKPAARRSGR